MNPTAPGNPPIQLSDAQRRDWLRLIRSENVGPITFIELINRFGSAAEALAALPDLARHGGAGRTIKIAAVSDIDREMDAADAQGIRFVALGESAYPALLRQIDAPPPILSVCGDGEILTRDCIAVVGARNASVAGRKITGILTEEWGRQGYVIISGLARGIDAAAHASALRYATAAVFAGGLEHVYPKENNELFARILDAGGCGVSEMPLGWVPRGQDFPRRNRIISGLALATVVIEAAKRSGSLITARYALEQNRVVGAVPASPLDPRASGVNSLIRDGAVLITRASDLIDELTDLTAAKIRRRDDDGVRDPCRDDEFTHYDYARDAPGESEREALIAALGPTPVSMDDIIRETGLSAQLVQTMILELDVAGRLERHGNQTLSLLMH